MQPSLPLYGVPFAIKDNIDLAGVPTTAGCPDYAYVPEWSAFVVQRLVDAGGVPLGKANLDQFATGLVGARSPYGACGNAFDPAYVCRRVQLRVRRLRWRWGRSASRWAPTPRAPVGCRPVSTT
jgi:hypothetical protein